MVTPWGSRPLQREWLARTADFSAVIDVAEELRAYIGGEPQEVARDFPYMGTRGHVFGLAA